MTFWPNLGQAYWGRLRDETYAQSWIGQVRDWIADCPAQSNRQNVAGSAWRTGETGLRMSTYWPEAYHCFLESPAVAVADLTLDLKSCVEQARYLHSVYTANWRRATTSWRSTRDGSRISPAILPPARTPAAAPTTPTARPPTRGARCS